MSKLLQKEVVFLRQKTSDLTVKLQTANATITHITDEYERLRQAYLQLQRDRFGKKSERFVDDSPEQVTLFEDTPVQASSPPDTAPDTTPETAPDTTDEIEVLSYKRKKRGSNKPDLDALPKREVIVSVPDSDKICACGCQKEVIGYAISHRLHHQPAVFEMLIEKREKWACRKGCDGSVVTAPVPPRILPKCRATESLLAYIAISKVLDRQPLYHLEKSIEQRYGWRLPRATMARWLILMAERLQPLINLMKDQLIDYDVAAIDATTLQVLNEPNRAPETKSYAYCIRGGPPGKEVTLYEYNAYSQKDYVTETLLDFKGVIHCDASPVFNDIGSRDGITLSYCHAHARRKFERILKADKKGHHPLAKQAMTFYAKLYAIEREATVAKLTPADRFTLRDTKSRPLMAEFYRWLQDHGANALAKSPIGQAIAYALNHWDSLTTYLTDGRLSIDNNATERDIKPFVIARKNFLFACTQAGADSLGVHFSLILTARHHGLDPYKYYTDILTRIPLCKTLDDYEALLPWNIRL
jgi:transposase